MGRVVVAYHKPGRRGAGALVESLAASLGLEAAPLEEAPRLCGRGGLIVALLPARGGHLASLAASAWGRGCRVAGPMPPGLLGRYTALELSRSGCRGGFLAYWRAKRLAGLQDSDMGAAALDASRILGGRVEPLPYTPHQPPKPQRPGGCVVVASLLPGRLPGILASLGWRVVSGSMLESVVGEELVASWLAGIAGGPGGSAYDVPG